LAESPKSCDEIVGYIGDARGIPGMMAITTWQLLAQLDLLHQLQPPAFRDDLEWERSEFDEDDLEPTSF
jgi:hypothetical protein